MTRPRDRLSHHYHRVEADQLWVTADTNVPNMARAIRNWRTNRTTSPLTDFEAPLVGHLAAPSNRPADEH
jgi:hypothetical protein